MMQIKDTPVCYDVVKSKIEGCGLKDLGNATIREIVRLVNDIERETGVKYIRMEMGVPGLEPSEIGINAEIDALKNQGVASKYVHIDGIPTLKKETSRFIKLFMDITISYKSCVPTVGIMQAAFASFMLLSKYKHKSKQNVTLFLDPGFPVQKQQHNILGIKYETFDVYDYRGSKLYNKIESYLKKGNISSIIYSNPNNPSWICFTEEELKIIGNLAAKYDVVVIEDLAYFGMDFRQDISIPGVPPYQPTVARYTENYILMLSGSKIFSYAGQRIGMICVSDKLFNRSFPDMIDYFNTDNFGNALIHRALYSLSAGTAHSAQYGLAALLKAVNDGKYNFVEYVKEYGEKAKIIKKMFTDNGFKIVYAQDIDKPIADGFFFTFSYDGMNGNELLEKLLYYGISTISLSITGSTRTEGLRGCVSLIQRSQFNDLNYRLMKFHEHHR